MARRQLTLDNTVAAELAGSEDAVLRALRGHLGDVDFHLRGNVLTLDGDSGDVQAAATVVDELVELIEQGHEVAPGTIEAVTGALDADESPAEILDDVVWRHRNTKVAPKTVNQKRYVDSIRRAHDHLRDRPGRHRQDLPRGRDGRRARWPRARSSGSSSPGPRSRPASGSASCPGDIQAKVDPYLRPLFDALYDMLDPDRVNGYFERGVIEVAPLAFMRGRTLNDSFVILDEAQNTSPEQMKMFLTRLGFNSRMVVTGDITQIDLPTDQRSGPDRRRATSSKRSRTSPSSASAARTSSATSSCSGSSPPTAPTASASGRARRTRADAAVLTLELDVPGGAARRGRGGPGGGRRRRRPPRARARRRGADPRAQPRAPRQGRADRRARLPGRRLGPTAGPRELGDVAICPEHCTDVTEAAVHGVLHLCGYDHETDDGEMLALQRQMLRAAPDAEAVEATRS